MLSEEIWTRGICEKFSWFGVICLGGVTMVFTHVYDLHVNASGSTSPCLWIGHVIPSILLGLYLS